MIPLRTRFILTWFLIGGLVACSPTYTEKTGEYKLPDDLKDCKVFNLRKDGGSTIVVVRCPHSDTTTRSGKSANATVISP